MRACWLMANHHGLKWDEGFVDYCETKELVKNAIYKNMMSQFGRDVAGSKACKIFYVKGEEKKKWLQDTIGDTEDYGAIVTSIDVNYWKIRESQYGEDYAMHLSYKTLCYGKCYQTLQLVAGETRRFSRTIKIKFIIFIIQYYVLLCNIIH